MKKIFFGFVWLVMFFVLATGKILANEGTAQLAGKLGADGRCYAASVYVDGNYKLLMTCRGLKAALDPVKNRYVVWANMGERKQRLGEIVNGKLSANVPEKFESIFVTVEADSYPAKPTGEAVMTGAMMAIDFGGGVFDPTIVSGAKPTGAVVTTKIDERGAVIPMVTPAASGRLTSVVVGIGKTVLFGFVLLLVVVGVMSFLARRKNL